MPYAPYPIPYTLSSPNIFPSAFSWLSPMPYALGSASLTPPVPRVALQEGWLQEPRAHGMLCPKTLRRTSDVAKRDALMVKILMRKVFVALERLHSIGIVHRDVKPVRP